MKILVFGAELPQAHSAYLEAANLRTQQIVSALLDAEHDLHLLSWRLKNHPSSGVVTGRKRLTNTLIDFSKPGWIRQINQIERDFAPDCVVGIMWRGGMRSTRLRHPKPLWIDLYGDVPAENQISAFMRGSDKGVWSSIWKEQELLSHGDIFSTCSERQRYATIGRLGLLRRLTASTCGYEFVHTIPPGVSLKDVNVPLPKATNELIVRNSQQDSEIIPREAVVVLWSGSYNNWMDVETLFRGVVAAMSECEALHYVSTGGGSSGNVYGKFAEMASSSPYAQRFHLLGWQPYSIVKQLHSRAQIGLLVDAPHYETLLGTRTRLLEMANAGLAIIASRGCELVERLEAEQALTAFDTGDASAFSSTLLALARNPEQSLRLASNAQRVVREQYSFQATTRPLLEWVEQPRFAPDRVHRYDKLVWENRARLTAQRILWRAFGRMS